MINITKPANFKEVSQEELATVLSNSGNRGLGYFFAGDEITIDADAPVCGRELEATDGQDAKLVPYIGVTVNGTPRWVPFAAFRRWPSKDSAGFASKSELMKSLFVGSDLERLTILKSAHTIIVSDMVEGETRDWTACPAGFQGSIVYRTSKFPVLKKK